MFGADQLGHLGDGVAAPRAFEHALGVQGALACAVFAGIGDDEQVQGAMPPGHDRRRSAARPSA